MSVTEPIVVCASATDASIRSAAGIANAAGGGIVKIPAGNIVLSSALPVYSGVIYEGVAPVLQFSSDVPDSTFSWLSGTKLSGDGTFRAFEANNTDQGSPASPFTTNAISNFGIENMALDNFTDAIRIGAVNNIGLQFSKLRNLFITNCSGWGVFLTNFMHCDIQRIWTKLCQNGQYYAASVASATLSPGNSFMHTLFNIIPSDGRDNRLCRGIVFDAAVANALLNELRLTRIQNNAFSRSKLSVAATFTSSSTSIGVPDSTKFAVGMPVAFTASANGFTASQIYCVLSIVDGTHITLGNSRTSSAITSSGTTGLTLESWGFPCVEIVSAASTAHVQNLSANGVDIEGASSAALYVENAGTIDVEVSEVPGSKHADICLRSTTYSRFRSCNSAVTDIDGTSATATEYIGSRSTQIQRSARGLYYDNVNSVPTLSIRGNMTAAGGDIAVKGSNGLLYGSTAYAQHQTARDATVTLSITQAGDVIFNGAAGQTFTLPTISDANMAASMIGMEFFIYNVSANSLTVQTDGSQLFNTVAAKTSLTVATQTWLEVKACKTAGGTLFWTARAGALS